MIIPVYMVNNRLSQTLELLVATLLHTPAHIYNGSHLRPS